MLRLMNFNLTCRIVVLVSNLTVVSDWPTVCPFRNFTADSDVSTIGLVACQVISLYSCNTAVWNIRGI
jgi:hypothetical protein